MPIAQIYPYALLCSLIYMSPVQANQLSDDDLTLLSLEDLLNLTVTVASKTTVKSTLSPSTVSLFSRQDLDALGVTDLIDLLKFVPGFYPSFSPIEGNQSYLVTRGHAQKYANTVLFLLNGRRINEDYTGGINYLIRHFSLRNIDRVEVIRGPGSALYGANAFNGVVNMISRSDQYAGVSIGNNQSATADVGLSWQGHEWQLTLAGAARKDNGDHYQGIYDRLGLQQSTQDPNDSQQLDMSLGYQNLTWRSLLQQAAFEDYYLFRRVSDEFNQLKSKNIIHQLAYQIWQDSTKQLQFHSQWQQGKRKSQTMLAAQDDADYQQAPFLFGEDFEYQSFQFGLEGSVQMNEQWLLAAGAEHISSELPKAFVRSNYDLLGDLGWLGSMQTFNKPEQRTTLDKTRIIQSAYIQTQTEISSSIQWTMGLRYDSYNDVANRLNPRFSLVYQPQAEHVYKLIYGNAYRVPSLGDLYDEESGLTLGNQSLEPSTIQSFEAVYSYLTPRFVFSGSLFHNRIEDLIGFTSDDIATLSNIAKSDATGLELEWRWEVLSQLQLRGHITHLLKNTSTIQNNGSLIPSEQLSPKNYAMTTLEYKLNEQWSSNMQWSYRSSLAVLSDQSALSLINWQLNFQPIQQQQWQLQLRNVLDKRYQVAQIQQIGVQQGSPLFELPARGREIQLGYRMNF
jgi:outer membrane receptor for ferrienterochelin and colicins